MHGRQVFGHHQDSPAFFSAGFCNANAEVMKMKMAKLKAGIGTLQKYRFLRLAKDAKQGTEFGRPS